MYGDSDALPRFLASRRKHKNVWVGSFDFIWWGLTEPVRAVAYSLKELRKKPDAAPAPDAPPQPSTKWLHTLLAQARDGSKKSPDAGANAA